MELNQQKSIKQKVNQNKLAWVSKVLRARKELQKGVESEKQQNSYRQRDTPTVKGKPQMVHSGTKRMGNFNGQSRWQGWKPPN